ncbi:hypothetical protein Bca101_020908 [Brassica carinata]
MFLQAKDEEDIEDAGDGAFRADAVRADSSRKPPALLNNDFNWLIEITHIFQKS